MNEKKHVKFQGRLVIVGFGSVGQGTLPLLLRHIDMPLERIRIVTGDTRGVEEAKHFGVRFTVKPLTRENYRAVLEPLVKKAISCSTCRSKCRASSSSNFVSSAMSCISILA
jgi:homospermidine synthase